MNKKIIFSSLTIISFFSLIEADMQDMHKRIKKNINSSLNKAKRIIYFIPDKQFGKNLEQGQYDPKNQTAIIFNKKDKLFFTKITTHPTNPWLPDKKNLDPEIILIGSYTTIKNKKPEMPVTTYIFGVLEHAALPQNNAHDAHVRPMGSNPGTYAPITFQPSDQFASKGLIGNYFSNNKIATIHDPSGINKQEYTFQDVQEGGKKAPEGFVAIGSYASQPQSNGMIVSHAIQMINLYGRIKQEEDTYTSEQQ